VDDLIDLVDLFPTILDIAGEHVPEYTQGESLVDRLIGHDAAGLAVGDSGEGIAESNPSGDTVFAQVGKYHGYLKTTFPGGMPASGRHPSLVQGARTKEFSYIVDPDNGDEAYDLRNDPGELDNLLLSGSAPDWTKKLRERISDWEENCLSLRKELGVIPGDRGFYKGWE
jgi:arylsulfatase A-like enzyme